MAKKADGKNKAVENIIKAFGDDAEGAIKALEQYKQDSQKEAKSPPKEIGPIVIELTNLQKRYKAGSQNVQALNNISLNINQGEFVAITGPSGSGKSTLLQLIGGLDKPSSGDVIVDGKRLHKLSDRQLSIFRAQTVGFIFQFFYLQPFLNVETNVTVPAIFAHLKRGERKARALELAKAVGLDDRLGHEPRELSGGQMQRAAIARALMNRPKVLLADEPTGNLDRENAFAIFDLFEMVRREYGTTVIVVTHDQDLAARTDREIAMLDGEVVK